MFAEIQVGWSLNRGQVQAAKDPFNPFPVASGGCLVHGFELQPALGGPVPQAAQSSHALRPHQTLAPGKHRRLRPVSQVQFAQNVADVAFHGLFAEHQLGRNFRV